MPLSAAPERRPPARPSEASGGACSPCAPEAHAAFLVAVAGARDTAVLPADRGRTPGHCTAAPSARGRHVTGPPGRARRLRQPGRPEPTRHALEPRPVRDPGQQRCAPASCRPVGPPPGSSGAASAPARQQGPRAREAPRRRAPLPPETPPRREPPAAHGPTGESPRLPRSSSFLRISKQRLWPRALGARPGWPPFPRGGWGRLPRQPGASPPLPTPAGRPRAPHVLPTHSTGHKAHAPALMGSVRAALQPAPSEGRPIVTQGGCPVEATPRGLGSVQAAPPDPSSPSHAPLRAGPAWQLGGPGSLGPVPQAGKARGRKSGR